MRGCELPAAHFIQRYTFGRSVSALWTHAFSQNSDYFCRASATLRPSFVSWRHGLYRARFTHSNGIAAVRTSTGCGTCCAGGCLAAECHACSHPNAASYFTDISYLFKQFLFWWGEWGETAHNVCVLCCERTHAHVIRIPFLPFIQRCGRHNVKSFPKLTKRGRTGNLRMGLAFAFDRLCVHFPMNTSAFEVCS